MNKYIRDVVGFGAVSLLMLALAFTPDIAHAQSGLSSGKVTTAAPTYATGTPQPLSLDTSGNLRVVSSGGGGGTQDVNVKQVGGNSVTVTVPGALDVSCISGCVAGSGVSQGTATIVAPTYVNGTNNPLSLDLAGNLRVLVGNSSLAVTQSGAWSVGINAGSNIIGNVRIDQTTPGTTNGVVVNSEVPGTGATNLGKAEDAAHTTGDVGVFTLGVVTDGATGLAAAGDYSVFGTDTAGNERVVGSVASAVADSGNPVKIGGIFNTTLPTLADGNRGNLQLSGGGLATPFVTRANGSDAQSNSNLFPTIAVGTSTSSATTLQTAGMNFNGSTWDRPRGDTTGTYIVAVPPTTQADTLAFSAILANTTNATSVKGSAGTLFEISVYNNSATLAWLKLYNSASAPTCGSGTPVGRYIIPGATAGGAGSNVDITVGKEFTTGIAFCVTTGITDADTGAVAANAYTVNLTYK